MKKNFKVFTLALVAASAFAVTSCSDSDGDGAGSTPSGEDLPAVITGTYNVTSDSYVNGTVTVVDGGVLNISAGVTLTAKTENDDITDCILVAQGGKIYAVGTKDAPIIMTAQTEAAGAWGGLHICGKATVNVTGGEGTSEVGELLYGGSDDSDNSGELKYIVMKYAGKKLNTAGTKEANGFTFYGVGNGTKVSYLQAYRGDDDGYEFFGGTVNIKYCIATDCSDDSFDWTEGWRGNAQFLVAQQNSLADNGNITCDCLLECDGGQSASDSNPSNPTIANATLIGNSYSGAKVKGIDLKVGTMIQLYNTFVDADASLTSNISVADDGDYVNGFLEAGTSVLKSVVLAGAFTNNVGTSTYNFTAAGSNNLVSQTLATSADNDYYRSLTAAVATATPSVSSQPDGFEFTTADYVGAFADGTAASDWTAGWSVK